ncbi:cytochrome P450 [Micromonospora sp. HNM0581]|uniref:cytochrome P450 n=1 Tax=Micromonospora sp. HNM0581 TaxID=2716341 RepID=UPI00146A7981|nr:cytochrome P450 [Micromonospora sp. HNM0581]
MTALADRSGLRPPGPSAWTAPVLLGRMARNRLNVMRSVAARHGDAVRLPLGPKTLYFFNHPEHAKHVLAENPGNYHKGIGLTHARRTLGDGLLTSEGELWTKQRKVIQPVFQARRIARQAAGIAEEAERMAARLQRMVGGGPVDIRHEMTELTLGVLGRTLLDTDLGEFGGIGAAFEAVQDQAIFEMMSLSAVPTWVPLPRQLRFRRGRAELQDIVDRLVARRRAEPGGGQGRDDVVSRLIESTSRETDPQVARQRMRDELVTLLLAGHETTASTLTWTFHLLDQHHEVWERVHAEAVEVLGDRTPVYEDLHRLRYTAMVVDEVMRLYPPVWLLPRIAQGEDVVGKWHVPARADVVLCPYTLHRHPEFWPDPDRFDPMRFHPDRPSDRPRYAYIPFGAGPRFCVGNNLGLMEAVFVIACVVRQLRLSRHPGHRVVPEPMLTLRVRGGLPMDVHEA